MTLNDFADYQRPLPASVGSIRHIRIWKIFENSAAKKKIDHREGSLQAIEVQALPQNAGR
jgi:hypothetical protein